MYYRDVETAGACHRRAFAGAPARKHYERTDADL